jgi:hypothetical protein
MSEYDLAFSTISSKEAGSYKLIELPKELLALVENSIEENDNIWYEDKLE